MKAKETRSLKANLAAALKTARTRTHPVKQAFLKKSSLSRSGLTKLESGVTNPGVLTVIDYLRIAGGPKLSTILRRLGF